MHGYLKTNAQLLVSERHEKVTGSATIYDTQHYIKQVSISL